MPQANIINIAPNQHFFATLSDLLLENFDNEIANITILLPNHRSCREFQYSLLNKHNKNSIILPKIKAISDISFEDFFDFLPNKEIQDVIDELIDIKLISGIDYLLFLSQKIRQLDIFGRNIDANQSLIIATQLENLFDEIEKNEIDLGKLEEIDDSNLSLHRQITLDFLKSFHIQIKNSLIKDNIFFNSAYQNFIINKFVDSINKYGSKNPIIIAGSTGSLSAGKNLIKAISNAKNGQAIIYGFDQDLCDIKEEYHPNFLLNQLIGFLEITPNQVRNYNKNNQICDKSRSEFIKYCMLPHQKSDKWQNLDNEIDLNKISQDLSQNFTLIEAKDEIEEAKLIALALNEAQEATIIVNNDKVANLLKYELDNLNLSYNDSRNIPILNSKIVNFILLILQLIENDFASYDLLSVLKDPLFKDHRNPLIFDLENKILRQERTIPGINGIKDKLKTANDAQLNKFFNDFYKDISALTKITHNIDISQYCQKLVLTIEKLSNQPWSNILQSCDAQIEIFELFEKLKLQKEFIIHGQNPLQTFKTIFSKISYYNITDSNAPIQILSPVEARLVNRDLVIIASLNEGDFPEIESQNWLGKKIRKDLGVDKKLLKIGQNAYDFSHYLSNKQVILSRSLIKNDSISICSPFLLKFKALCQKADITLNNGQKYRDQLHYLQQATKSQLKRPNPQPKKAFRPKSLAITDISKLRQDPYAIYAKRILKLKELQKIDYEPGFAEFGSFVHKILEEYVKSPKNEDIFIKQAQEIFEDYFTSTQSQLTWWPKFENIFSNFLKAEEQFSYYKNYTEIPAQLIINDITLRGKIDRVAINEDNQAHIYDYKTGQTASAKSVIAGGDPQLTISALMIIEGLIENNMKNINAENLSSINYWKVSLSSNSEIKTICKNNEELQILISAAKSGLEKLFSYFDDENNGYISAPKLSEYKKNEYHHLARIDEWK